MQEQFLEFSAFACSSKIVSWSEAVPPTQSGQLLLLPLETTSPAAFSWIHLKTGSITTCRLFLLENSKLGSMLVNKRVVVRHCRSATCKPLAALKTQSPVKTAKQSQRSGRSKQAQPSSSDTPVSAVQYLLAAGLSAAAGVALTAAPETVWQLLGSNDVVNVTLTSTQVYGVYWIMAAAGSYRLAKAAESDNLSSATYQRLNACLALFTAASAVPFLQGIASGELSTTPAAAVAATLAAAAATTYAPGYLGSSGSTDISELAAGFGDALKSTFKAGRGLIGAFYSLNFWEDFILGVALLGGPILPTVAGDISGTTTLAKDLVGIGTLLYASFVWLLLDAADRNRLGASTFRALNGACCAVSICVGAVCVLGQANGIATNMTNQTVVLVSCLLTATVFGYQAVKTAKD